MASSEVHTSRLAFFGRLGDDLTRQVLRPEEMSVSLEGDPRPALRKEDGHFALVDLEPSTTDYNVRLGGPAYQTRTVAKALPTLAPVQVTFPGEDELYLVLAGTSTPQNRVNFQTLAFVPPIDAGAAVIGEGGFTATLAEPLEGRDVSFAVLSTIAGLAAGQVLRIVRSPNLLVRPGPYYAFPDDVTVVAVHVVENDPAEPPIGDATIAISQIDGSGPTVIAVGGLPLQRFALAASATAFVVLDAGHAITTTTVRGDGVFYFPGSTPLASLELTVAKPQYQTATVTLNVTGWRWS